MRSQSRRHARPTRRSFCSSSHPQRHWPVSAPARGSHPRLSPQAAAAAAEPSVYETEAHICGAAPGLGMRVSVSKQDLAALEREEEAGPAHKKRE